MPIKNHYDDGTPLRFCEYYLEQHAGLMARYGGPRPSDRKYFEAPNIAGKPGNDFLIYRQRNEEIILHAGVKEYIGKVSAVLDVLNIRKYPDGGGSEMDFRETMKMLREALCGHNGVEIFMGDPPVKIGDVDESRYLDKIDLTGYREGNFDVLQKGISVLITYR